MEYDPRKRKKTVYSQRPWGEIYMVVRNQKCSVDLTTIIKGNRSSLHSHKKRYELFHLLSDGAAIEIDGAVHHPKAHEELLINPGQVHRFWALTDQFSMLVVSFRRWQAKDQIRHEDDYGREGQELSL